MTKKRAIIILVIIGIVGVVVVYAMANRGPSTTYTTVLAEEGSIIQTVSETGTVKSESEIELSFINSGQLALVNVAVGDSVLKDTVLAELNYSRLSIMQDEATANVEVAQEGLNKLLSGATTEDVAISKAQVIQAKSAYDAAQNELGRTKAVYYEKIAQAEKTLKDLEFSTAADITTEEQAVSTAQTNLFNTITTNQKAIDDARESGLTGADDKLAAARTALDAINRVLTDEDAKDLISIQDPRYLMNTEADYQIAMGSAAAAELQLAIALNDDTNSSTLLALDQTAAILATTFSALQNCFMALDNSVTSSGFTQSELDAFKTNISTQQTTIGTAISTVQTMEQDLNDALINYDTTVASKQDALAQAEVAYDQAITAALNGLSTARLTAEQQITAAESKVGATREAWQVTQAQLNKTQAPANKHDLGLSRAKVRQAEAALNAINQQIGDSVIKAPVDGIVTKVNYEVGEQVTAGQATISMLGQNDFEIEVLISEADIAKISLKDTAHVTLDAFGDDTEFAGEVFFIEPAETVIQDVIYYKVKIYFDPAGVKVKSGMTANITITTEEKTGVLIVPSRAITQKNGNGKFVKVLVNNQVQEREIKVGLRGDGGMAEVLEGIHPGDTIVTRVKEN